MVLRMVRASKKERGIYRLRIRIPRDVIANHGWRHRFKTVGWKCGIEERILDEMCGHAPPTVGRRYGDATVMAASQRARQVSTLSECEVSGVGELHDERQGQRPSYSA